jgi:hypothetical protein
VFPRTAAPPRHKTGHPPCASDSSDPRAQEALRTSCVGKRAPHLHEASHPTNKNSPLASRIGEYLCLRAWILSSSQKLVSPGDAGATPRDVIHELF